MRPAGIQLLLRENGKSRSVIFCGDFGPKRLPILRDVEHFQHADLFSLNLALALLPVVLPRQR